MSNSFMNQWVYTDTVKDHFINPRNIWNRDDEFEADGEGEVGSLACGDQMRIGIKVVDNVIVDLKWLTYGCASAIASTSMMTVMAKGMTLEDAYHITPDDVTKALGGLPNHKFHCSVLGDKALRAAIDDYLEKNDMPNPYKKKAVKVICECNNVTDQMIEELVKNDKVKNLDELREQTNYGTTCGKCKDEVATKFEELMHIYGK
jgi:nitrogen fixation NifU-like protein